MRVAFYSLYDKGDKHLIDVHNMAKGTWGKLMDKKVEGRRAAQVARLPPGELCGRLKSMI